MPSRKKLFGVAFNQLCTVCITSSSSANCWPHKCSFIGPNKWKSDGAILNLHSSVDFRRFHTLWPQKTNNTSLLFHGASWQWSGHVVRPIAQAQTAWSSRPLYVILLRSHFVSRNKIFRCAYFSMHFRIKFLLFNDFPSYILICKIQSFRLNNFKALCLPCLLCHTQKTTLRTPRPDNYHAVSTQRCVVAIVFTTAHNDHGR